jgi:hypothetical protein
MTAQPPITPETRVAELLEAYPNLEELLIQQAPAFKALKNPILRRTVARVATLEKAAQVAGIPARQLVSALRHAVGQAPEDFTSKEAGPPVIETRPDWLDEQKVRVTINADDLLAAGQVPLNHVNSALQELESKDLLKVVSSFPPAPLIEAVERAGHKTHVVQVSRELFHTYVLCARTISS